MDPQKLSQLDPKLRDAYQRVMGTTISEPQATPASPRGEPVQTQAPPPAGGPPIPQPQPQSEPEPITPPVESPIQPFTPEPQPAPTIPEPIAEPQPAISPQPEAIPTPESTTPTQQTSNFVQMNSEVPASPAPTPNFITPIQTQTIAVKKKNNILIVMMIGITILVFIVVYGLFWAKIFNFQLPFLP